MATPSPASPAMRMTRSSRATFRSHLLMTVDTRRVVRAPWLKVGRLNAAAAGARIRRAVQSYVSRVRPTHPSATLPSRAIVETTGLVFGSELSHAGLVAADITYAIAVISNIYSFNAP